MKTPHLQPTLQNLWRAWISRYDADRALRSWELRAFASADVCPSSDAYMRTLHEWAVALVVGDLDVKAAFVGRLARERRPHKDQRRALTSAPTAASISASVPRMIC